MPDNHDPQMIDLALVAAAVHTLERAPTTANTDQVARALTVLERANLGHGVWPDLLTLLVPDDRPPAPHLVPFIARLLARPDLRGVDRGLVARLSAERALHPALRARLLDDSGCHHAQVHTTYSRIAAEACPDPAARDDLLVDFIAAAGAPAAEIDTPLGCDDRARFLACLPIFTAHAAPEWLAVYRALRDPHFQLLTLNARLARITPEYRQQLRELIAADWDPPEHDHDEAAARTWLITALA